MTRRTIQRADEAMVRRVAMRALGGSAAVLFWNGPGAALSGIQVDMGGGHSRVMRDREVEALDAAGIHPGASGWEIEDAAGAALVWWETLMGWRLTIDGVAVAEIAQETNEYRWRHIDGKGGLYRAGGCPTLEEAKRSAELAVIGTRPVAPAPEASPARPPLPRGFGWFERGVDSYSLDGPDGKPIARARASTVVPGTGVWQIGDGPWWPVASLPDAKRAAEDACRAAGLFDFIHVRVARVLGVEVEQVIVVLDNASDTIERVEVYGLTVHEETLDKLRTAGFKVRPKVEAEPAFPSDGGVDREAPTGAAQAFSRALLFVAGFDETGFPRQSAGSATEYLAYLDGLTKAFVDAMRREVAPAEEPRGIEDAGGAFVGSRVERSTDAALTSYLAEHYPNERRPGEDALALAIRLLAEQRSEIRAAWSAHEAAREEARVADENAAELAADLKRIREDILKAAADLAARMGAPHG